jgi:hypothetical protein
MNIKECIKKINDLDDRIKLQLAETLCWGDDAIDPEDIGDIGEAEDGTVLLVIYNPDGLYSMAQIEKNFGQNLLKIGIDKVTLVDEGKLLDLSSLTKRESN